jgi:hypothetical protein
MPYHQQTGRGRLETAKIKLDTSACNGLHTTAATYLFDELSSNSLVYPGKASRFSRITDQGNMASSANLHRSKNVVNLESLPLRMKQRQYGL